MTHNLFFRFSIVAISFFSNSSFAALDSGLVGYWNFNEGCGNIIHNHANYYHVHDDTITDTANLNAMNSPQWIAGKIGYGLRLNGINNCLLVNPNFETGFGISYNFSWSLWVRPKATISLYPENANAPYVYGHRFVIQAPWGGYDNFGTGISVGTNGVSIILHKHNVMLSKITYGCNIDSLTWTHIGVSVRNDTTTLYINGDSVRCSPAAGVLLPGISIGESSYPSSYNNYYKGDVDEVRLYNRGLGSSEIKSLFCPLECHLPFNENSGDTAFDSTSNHIDGSIHGATIDTINGIHSNCLDFDGTDDYVEITKVDDFKYDTVGTISLWALLDHDNNDLNGILNFSDANGYSNTDIVMTYDMRYTQGVNLDIFNIVCRKDSVYQWALMTTADDIDTLIGKWVHIAVVQDADSARLYINGIERTVNRFPGEVKKGAWFKTVLTDAVNKADILRVGTYVYKSVHYRFDGRIDDVRIYNKPLSVSEVQDLFDEFNPYTLSCHLPFNENSGDTAYDSTINHIDGSIHGAIVDTVNGIHGNCLGFDGTDDYVEITKTNEFKYDTVGTISLWASLDHDNNNLNGILNVSDANGYSNTDIVMLYDMRPNLDIFNIVCRKDGVYQWALMTTADDVDTLIGKWAHIAVVQDADSARLYINGIERTVNRYPGEVKKGAWFKTVLTDATNKANIIRFGTYVYSSVHYRFDGLIDDVRIYNKPLSASEVQDLFNEFNPY
jgi:hypothetical protein